MNSHHHYHAAPHTRLSNEPLVEEPCREGGGRFEIIDDRIRQNESEDDMDDTDSMTMSESTRSLSLASNENLQKSRFVRQETGGSTNTTTTLENQALLKATLPEGTHHLLPTQIEFSVLDHFDNKENRVDNIPHAMSRFKLVHVDARFHRGRWKCWDYMEDEKPKPDIEQTEIELEKPKSNSQSKELETQVDKSGNVKFSVGETVDDERSPKFSPSPQNNEALNSTQVAQASNSDWLINYLMTGRNTTPNMSPAVNAPIEPNWPNKDPLPPPTTQAEPTAVLSLSSNEQNLDSKIQQAMDLVKTHLMFAVHEEVNTLRAQLAELRNKEQRLVMENTLLRSHATAETLAKLEELSKRHELLSPIAPTTDQRSQMTDSNRPRSHTAGEARH